MHVEQEARSTSNVGRRLDDRELHLRISAEFTEMPGLKLTLSQASRLFHMEQARCARVLGALVRVGALASDGKTFARVG